MRRLAGLAFAASLLALTAAHIGSPNVLFDGNAGPYPVRVIVRPPEVVPGLAEVIVRLNAPDAQRVSIRPVFWRAGVRGAPSGDEISRVPGEAQRLFRATVVDGVRLVQRLRHGRRSRADRAR